MTNETWTVDSWTFKPREDGLFTPFEIDLTLATLQDAWFVWSDNPGGGEYLADGVPFGRLTYEGLTDAPAFDLWTAFKMAIDLAYLGECVYLRRADPATRPADHTLWRFEDGEWKPSDRRH